MCHSIHVAVNTWLNCSFFTLISFITDVLFCDQKTSFSRIRLRLRPNLSSEVRPNSASAKFEEVKFGATLAVTEPVDTEKGVPYGFFLTSNVHKIHFWPGLRPRPRWRELMTLIYAYKSVGLI